MANPQPRGFGIDGDKRAARNTEWFQHGQFPHIDIIPSNPLLARFDLSDAQTWEKSDLQLAFVDPINALQPLYDVIVFDCPPRLSLVSFAALCASDAVIVPLEAADWGAQGIVQVAAAT